VSVGHQGSRTPMRDTRQRRAVVNALAGSTGFESAQDLHAALRDAGERIGLATVYRTLQAMVDAGEVDMVRDDTGEQRFRRCEVRSHHHHLVCRSCGAVVEVESAAVEQWAAEVAGRHGFTDVGHDIEVYGRCPACTAAGGAGSG